MVATQDIGRTGAGVMQQPWTGTRYIEVAGPRKYSALDVAQAFAAVLGHKVEVLAVPRETWVQTFVAHGMPEDRTAPRAEMLDGLNSGWIDFGVAGTERVTGVTELQSVLQTLVSRTESKAAHR